MFSPARYAVAANAAHLYDVEHTPIDCFQTQPALRFGRVVRFPQQRNTDQPPLNEHVYKIVDGKFPFSPVVVTMTKPR